MKTLTDTVENDQRLVSVELTEEDLSTAQERYDYLQALLQQRYDIQNENTPAPLPDVPSGFEDFYFEEPEPQPDHSEEPDPAEDTPEDITEDDLGDDPEASGDDLDPLAPADELAPEEESPAEEPAPVDEEPIEDPAPEADQA